MTIDQLTDLAWEVTNELEPARSYDVFDVSESHIIFQGEHGLKRVCVACPNDSLKEQITKQLREYIDGL
jgi:hypothetical protein